MTVTNEASVGLPSLAMTRKETWDYYRIEFLEDGYPGRRSDAGLHPHPIYGTYVIRDYVAQYRKYKDEVFLKAAERVADAAIARMSEHHGALVFYYHPGTGLSSLPNVFYSGLTQARYLSALGKLEAALPSPRYAEAAEAILFSMEVPAEDGGVARRTPGGGLLIEEYSHQVPDYTLNGWTTATTLLHEYAEATGNDHARVTFEQSVHGIRDVLPLYDVPELANSRYRLTGPATIRLDFSHPGVTVLNGRVEIPGQGAYAFGADGGKWTNRFLAGVGDAGVVEGRHARMEVLLCRVSWPRLNRIVLEVDSPADGKVTATIGQGPYHPLKVQMPIDRYEPLATVPLQTGRHLLEISVPWTAAERIAYPTNFKKSLGGKQYNSYHFIHIDTLDALERITRDPMLAYYRDRWTQYPGRWPGIPEYLAEGVALERYKAPGRA